MNSHEQSRVGCFLSSEQKREGLETGQAAFPEILTDSEAPPLAEYYAQQGNRSLKKNQQATAKQVRCKKPRATLTSADAVEIYRRSLHRAPRSLRPASQWASAAALAREYGVSEKAIRDIWTGRTWAEDTRHLDSLRAPRTARPKGRPPGRRDNGPRRRKAAAARSEGAENRRPQAVVPAAAAGQLQPEQTGEGRPAEQDRRPSQRPQHRVDLDPARAALPPLLLRPSPEPEPEPPTILPRLAVLDLPRVPPRQPSGPPPTGRCELRTGSAALSSLPAAAPARDLSSGPPAGLADPGRRADAARWGTSAGPGAAWSLPSPLAAARPQVPSSSAAWNGGTSLSPHPVPRFVPGDVTWDALARARAVAAASAAILQLSAAATGATTFTGGPAFLPGQQPFPFVRPPWAASAPAPLGATLGPLPPKAAAERAGTRDRQAGPAGREPGAAGWPGGLSAMGVVEGLGLGASAAAAHGGMRGAGSESV